MRSLFPYLVLYIRHKWILMLGIALAVITMSAGIGLLTLSGWFISASVIAGSITGINYMLPAAGIRAASIIRILGRYFERLSSHDITLRIVQDLRVTIFKKLLPLSPSGLISLCQRKIFNRVITDIDILDHIYLRVFTPLVSTLIVVIAVIVGLSILDLTYSLLVSSTILFTSFILSFFIYYIGKKNGVNLIYFREKYLEYLVIWLQNQAELTIFGASLHYRTKMKKMELKWYEAQRRQSALTSVSKETVILIRNLSILLLLWIISDNLNNNEFPRLKGASISLFFFCTLGIFEVLVPIVLACQYLGQVVTSACHITKILKKKPKVCFIKKSVIKIPSNVSLRFNCVSFTYDRQLQSTLKEVTFSIDAGTHVAILGHTGCGKSTLIKMITRAWNPQQGNITINNIPLNQFDEQALRTIISVVPQRVHLFNATLRDNLLLSISPSEENDRKFYSVLKQVELHSLIKKNGLNTWLGEGGRQLSGGELRRLAIARAILQNAPLMLLDEPTGELDAITEIKILKLFKEVMNNKTLLMVTHKLRRLESFDKVIIMDNGKIVEQNKNKELLAKWGYY